MIERVDTGVQSEFDSEVIPIKYAKAEDIASALSSLSGSGSATTVGTRSAGAPAATSARPGLGGYNPNQPTIPGATQGQPSSTGSFSERMSRIIQNASRTSGSGDFQIIGPNKIVADVRANALIVFAAKPDMVTIKKIIGQLDVVLAQVLIETIILDVTLTDGHNLGLSYLQKRASEAGNFTGIGALNNTGFLTPGHFSALTNASGALGGGFCYLGRFGQDLDVTLTAIASDSSVKVVQKPRIMTSHATPASVFIGSTVPYVSGTYYGGGFGGGPSSQYQQLKVGISLSVTPYINQDGLVVMQIDEAIDEISGSVPITGVGNVPTTTSRTLTAEVAVGDRETIVLGGFIRSSGEDNKSGMPILKDIPLLGKLFTSSSKSKSRNELLVLMRPTVLRTPELAAAHTDVEKARLPGIRRAEAENEAEELKRVKSADGKLGTAPRVESSAPPAKAEASVERDSKGFYPVPE
jgi:general secretion pathway protein D